MTNTGGWYNQLHALALDGATLSAVGGFPGFGHRLCDTDGGRTADDTDRPTR